VAGTAQAGERAALETALIGWLEGRTIPKNRRFVDQILAQAGLVQGDTLGIINVCRGLAVTDSYWVVPAGDQARWAAFNLFDNELDEALALVAYTGHSTGQHRRLGLSSEWTTHGQYPKAWRRVNGELELYKAGTQGFANAGMEPYSEFFASELAAACGLPHVHYRLEQWQGRLASVCPAMTSSAVSLVTMYDTAAVSEVPAVLAAGALLGPDVLAGLEDMLVFDALIANGDRHANNYGFLRSAATGELMGMAPLFDHNLALFAADLPSDYAGWAAKAGALRPSGSALTFNQVAALVMAPRHHEMLRALLTWEPVQCERYPLDTARTAALGAYLRARAAELLAVPCAAPLDTQALVARELPPATAHFLRTLALERAQHEPNEESLAAIREAQEFFASKEKGALYSSASELLDAAREEEL
jgi:hypothetical protein